MNLCLLFGCPVCLCACVVLGRNHVWNDLDLVLVETLVTWTLLDRHEAEAF